VKIGIFFPGSKDPGVAAAALAREAEERGFDSFFVGEHSNSPVGSASTHPLLDEVPDFYMQLPAPFIVLAAAAATTERIRLGTAIALLGQRDPIHFAKETATLDVISDGRLSLGIGYAWNTEEFANHGLDPKLRRQLLREKMLAIRSLWEDEVSSYDGEYVSIAPTVSFPKPVQRPGPPVLLGGPPTPGVFRHLLEFCDGWMPAGGHGGITKGWAQLRELATEQGRDPDSLTMTVSGPRATPEVCAHYRDAGADEILLNIMGDTRTDVMNMLESHVDLAAELDG
jgi:probable F420-dependent oxidoreductase